MSVRTLRLASLIYLLLPAILFTLGWFDPIFSIPVLIGFGFLTVRAFRERSDVGADFTRQDLFYLAGMGLVLTLYSGIAGLSAQMFDHWGHNAKYYDLTVHNWPLFFPERDRYATYYFGFYLVPAFLSKITLGRPYEPFLAGWTAIGFFLGISWVYLVTGRRKLLLLLLPLVGGLNNGLKELLLHSFYGNHPITPHLYGFVSWFDQLQWVPNQLVSCTLISGMLLYNAFHRRQLESTFFPITLSFIWAVFPGAFFVVLYGFILIQKSIGQPFLKFFRETLAAHLVAGLIFLPTFVYLNSGDGMPVAGFIWEYEAFPKLAMRYFLSVVLDLGILYALCRYVTRQFPHLFPSWFVTALFVLFFLATHYRVGYYNDWLMRLQQPMLTITGIIILRGLAEAFDQSPVARPAMLKWMVPILILWSPIALRRAARTTYRNAITTAIAGKPMYNPIPYDKYPNTYQFLLHKHSQLEANQYLGKKNSVYERYLANKGAHGPLLFKPTVAITTAPLPSKSGGPERKVPGHQ
ncbi:hypothetical protein [Tellurirhabdus rosea]|uniref:hypothetical protein n=1 Tax=Tellurirhabdus rosea TaxID=2674997 RepID=UPI00224EC8DC|nr:hypothetical protein [Tellurirhabdus rosea]